MVAGNKRGGYHSKHGHKPVKASYLRNGSTNVSCNMRRLTFLQIVELARKRGQSLSAFTGELIEYALADLEDQGEIVLNRHKGKLV